MPPWPVDPQASVVMLLAFAASGAPGAPPPRDDFAELAPGPWAAATHGIA